MTKDELKSLFSKDPISGCWPWSGPDKLRCRGMSGCWYPHRLLFTLVNKRPIQPKHALIRLCNTVSCVAPAHYVEVPKEYPISPKHKDARLHTTRSQPF